MKEQNSNQKYQAQRMSEEMKGGSLLDIKEIVQNKILSSDIAFKKEEIIEHVCRQIKLPIDIEISGAIGQALKKLESEGILDHVSQGYWKKH